MTESTGEDIPVVVDLRQLPPVTMPDDIVLRIEEALARLAVDPGVSALVDG